tara:strand:- start:617 stop:1456 length:840 start_codon:yes stop_codon:yes gene_type:complete
MFYEKVIVAGIDVDARLRDIDQKKIESLSQSMDTLGLLSPIIVFSPDDETVKLVAGGHRLEAAKNLGWETIDAYIMEGDELHAQLAEIDENLMRSELTATEYAEHMQRRKEVWEAIQANENSGTTCPTNPDEPDRSRGRPQEFAESTEQATGQSKRNTNRATKRARTVCQQARDLIRGTKADTGVFLDQLSKLAGDQEQIESATEKVEALNDEQRRRDLRDEQKERERVAKENREQARAEFVNLLFENLTQQQWERAIRLLDDCGGSIRVTTLRDWEAA